MQQVTTKTAEEAHYLPRLPNEIILMIFDNLIADAAADCQPITWDIHQGMEWSTRRRSHTAVTYHPEHQEPRELLSSMKRFNSIRLPLHTCSWNRALTMNIFHPFYYRSNLFRVFRAPPLGDENYMQCNKQTGVWTNPILDVFCLSNIPVDSRETHMWPFSRPSRHQTSLPRQLSVTTNGILRVVQNVRFDWAKSGIKFPEDLSGALEWCLSLPNVKRIDLDKHPMHPTAGVPGYLRTGRFQLASGKFGPENLHLAGLPNRITFSLQRRTTDKAPWKALRERRVPVVIRDRAFSEEQSHETDPLEIFLDESDEICFRLFFR
ncbi:hypothetical protein BDP55DRAFT_636671 [Colletotrichum godetiae]|uniref:Uncharacterized protein n=1 Tax=Colletotrichum godetiae TaxID=1209918 RepID=A0AAJ0ABU1_9PEZI|nr:uncharacterized protein BDP55DRAFT_636671 [Colletotrichum godetiae]KAK1659684.1 hypothetical protein BDP55DRAFT_636671 [Colletotrichum godetiae]